MLKKIQFKAGINLENTRYTTEGGFYACNNVRFRQGFPEKIGGWANISSTYATYNGIAYNLWAWQTLTTQTLLSVGTNSNYYINYNASVDLTPNAWVLCDVTPNLTATTLTTTPFTATVGSNLLTVNAPSHGAISGDTVVFNGAASLGGAMTAAVLNNTPYTINYVSGSSYTINTSVTATSADTGHGGAAVIAIYKISSSPLTRVTTQGWGSGGWSSGSWNHSPDYTNYPQHLWSQGNFGQDFVFAYRGGPMYYWSADVGLQPPSSSGLTGATVTISNASPAVAVVAAGTLSTGTVGLGDAFYFTTTGVLPAPLSQGAIYYAVNVSGSTFNLSTSRTGTPLVATTTAGSGVHSLSAAAIPLQSKYGADGYCPTTVNYVFVSDIYRFVFAFGVNYLSGGVWQAQDPMLIAWSDQENAAVWQPTTANQAGNLRLSRGSQIICACQARQELLVFTNTALYAMQYIGSPYVWNAQLLNPNISVISQNAVVSAAGVVYWMGRSKFYKYDGVAQTLPCDLKRSIFTNINSAERPQIIAGTNEGFNEVWWFYPSASSTFNDTYAVYNYDAQIWYNGTMPRSAWINTGVLPYPVAAIYSPDTTTSTLVYHENGVDDNTTSTPAAIGAFIESSEVGIVDGHQFAFIRRIMPDITFTGSTNGTFPAGTMRLSAMNNSGSGYSAAVPGSPDYAAVNLSTQATIINPEVFTGQAFVRLRGRQFVFRFESDQIGTTWQLGTPRIDWQPDGRRSVT